MAPELRDRLVMPKRLSNNWTVTWIDGVPIPHPRWFTLPAYFGAYRDQWRPGDCRAILPRHDGGTSGYRCGSGAAVDSDYCWRHGG